MPTKYNNECPGGDEVLDIIDEQYESEIVAWIR